MRFSIQAHSLGAVKVITEYRDDSMPMEVDGFVTVNYVNSNVNLVLLSTLSFLVYQAGIVHVYVVSFTRFYMLHFLNCLSCFIWSHVTTERAWKSLVYLRIYIKKSRRGSAPLMCNCSFYHFKQNTVMQGEDRSQMAMFMDYLPKVVVNYKHMNLLAAFCQNQLYCGYGNNCLLCCVCSMSTEKHFIM